MSLFLFGFRFFSFDSRKNPFSRKRQIVELCVYRVAYRIRNSGYDGNHSDFTDTFGSGRTEFMFGVLIKIKM